jgi:hypothetical protein
LRSGSKIRESLVNEEIELELCLDSEECQWEETEAPPEEIPLPIFTEEETDDEADVHVRQNFERYQLSYVQTRENTLAWESDLVAVDDLCLGCEQVDCVCREPNLEVPKVHDGKIDDAEELEANEHVEENEQGSSAGEPEEEDNASTHLEEYDSDGYIIPPASCTKGHGQFGAFYYNCEFCGGFGLGSDQDEEAYTDSDSDDDDPLEEDEEHFDSEERIGMLFSTFEPGILLACKEIREQCLPVYYGMNAFSWRLFWQSPRRSLERFIGWTEVVGENTKHIRKISFESRHAVEEGIEFEVDIDLLDRAPFYEVQADCDYMEDELTTVTVEAIEQDFLAVLYRMSKRYGGVIKFRAEDIHLLGKVFWEAMKRDPGVAGDRGQWG